MCLVVVCKSVLGKSIKIFRVSLRVVRTQTPARRSREAMGKHARLDAFARGQIVGLQQAGETRFEITRLVKKKDGKRPTLRTVDNVLRKKDKDPVWRGGDSRAGGRPPALSAGEVRQLVGLVFKERGKSVVTAAYCMKRLPFLRKVVDLREWQLTVRIASSVRIVGIAAAQLFSDRASTVLRIPCDHLCCF